MNVEQCQQGFKYLMVNKDGVMESVLYAVDVSLMASNDQLLQMIFDSTS